MKQKKMMVGFLTSLLVVVFLAGFCLAQGQVKEQKASDKQVMETIKGKIDYNERMGGYFIKGVEPGGEFFIINQNAKVLKKLKDSGKTATFEGRAGEGGAEYFVIDKINGKKYVAPKTPTKKSK